MTNNEILVVDAQRPRRLSLWLGSCGHDSLHTSDLPDGSRTSDTGIAAIADADSRVVITKDRDFRDGHPLRGSPAQLLVVSTGNISNNELLDRFDEN